jgi:signal transduction histidine kinase
MRAHRATRLARREEHRSVRYWPGGISGRIACIVVVALFAFLVVSIFAHVGERARATLRLFTHATADQIVAVVSLLEATPRNDRARILAAVNSPTLKVALAGGPVTARTIGGEPERFIRSHLGALGNRPLEVALAERPDHTEVGLYNPQAAAIPDLAPSQRKALISVGLEDGGWAVFTVATDLTSLRWAFRFAAWVVIGGVVIALAAFWASRRVTAPLRAFAAAADRLGADLASAPPLPERGPADLRRASIAFNRMQGRLKRVVADRTQMVAALSHDLRTALTRLQLRAEFIADPEQQRKAVADLDEMRTMLEQTLSLSREEINDEPVEPVDLASLAQTLCHDLADAGQKVAYDGPDRLAFACRRGAIKRALANLIDNAVRYGGQADVSLAETAEGVAITVADRGPGIPADMIEKVFEPFVRLETSRSRETGGHGLGLALARAAARRHGGDVTLAARSGGGLVATLTLPKLTS